MRYRVKAGRAALARRYERGGAKKAPAAAPPQTAASPCSAACDNPYYRCYGSPRRLEELRNINETRDT